MLYNTPTGQAAKIIGISSARLSQIHSAGGDKGSYRSKGRKRLYDMDKLAETLTRNISTENQDRRGKAPGVRIKNFTDEDPDTSTSENGSQPKQPLDGSFNEARRRNEWIKAAKSKLELDLMQGDLVKADVVKSQAAECARLVKSTLISIPDRLAGLLAAESDQNKIKAMLKAELRNAMEAMGSA